MGILDDHIADFRLSALATYADKMPWELTQRSVSAVERLLRDLGTDFRIEGNIAVHSTSTIESGAVIKGPAIIGPNCFVASGALVRGGCWLEADCIIGPCAELKSSFVFRGSKLAHFNFVGDSILGREVNLEAGSVIANYRNEQTDPTISFRSNGEWIETGVEKFGALVGDCTKVGANAVIAPGAILAKKTIVGRLSLVDQKR